MQFKQYPSYKPSGVEWLGDVPEHWQVKPNKYVFKIQKRIAGTLGFNVLSITQKGLKIKDIESNAGQMAQDYSKYQIVNVGDFAMNHMDLLTGWVDIAKVTGVTSPDYRVFEVRNKKVNKEYFLHLFQLGYRNKILFAFGQGAAQMGRWRLQSETFNSLKMPFPSIEEQEKIVSFLDTETARIDTLIAKQEKLIELLEEQRKSIISHAVTKGLNPNAPMKDSGVEWLGEVPEHWKIGRLKNLLSIHNGSDYKEFEVENSEKSYPVYGSGGVFTYSSKYIYDQESVLLGRKGTINKPLYVTSPFWAVDTMFYSQVKRGVYGKYVYYQALGFPYDRYSSNTALPSMTQTDLLNLSVTIPSISEQIEITQFLDNENAKFDNLIYKQKNLIEKLKEYRSSIISHAVTGKIDVREFC